MPELIVPRRNAGRPPMVCMYCGAPATTAKEWREANRKPEKAAGGGGTDLSSLPTGDDPVSGVIALVILPLVLWELLVGLAAGVGAVAGYLSRPRPTPAADRKPKEPPTTLVVVTACDRHRRFGDRFVWAGAVALAGLWAWAVGETRRVMGTEEVGLAVALLVGAVFATVLIPLGVSAWYAFAGPVTADRVTEDAVVLDRVRPAYFAATGRTPGQ
jgi:hypothetical protein